MNSIVLGPLNDILIDHVDAITGASPIVDTYPGYPWDDPATCGALDAPTWTPTGSHRVVHGCVFGEH